MASAPGGFGGGLEAFFDDIRGGEKNVSRLVEACRRLFAASKVSLFLHDRSSGSYVPAACAGGLLPSDAVVIAGVGIAGVCIEQKRPMLVFDPVAEERLQGRSIERRTGWGSAMVLPLWTEDQGVLGVLNLARSEGTAPFDEAALAEAHGVGAALSFLFANAELLANLEAEQAKLAGVLHSLGVAVWAFDSSGDVSDLNDHARKWQGESETWGDLLDSLDGHSAKVIAAVRDEAFQFEAVIQRELSMGSRTVRVAVVPLSEGGFVLSLEDTTDFGRLQRMAEIGQMTAAIAHEIRNPLTGVRSAAQMITQHPEHAREFATIIEAEAIKLNDLCTDFLDFARPLELRRQLTPLRPMLEALLARNQETAANQNVSLSLESSPDEKPVYIEPHRVEQVALNLILNAIQACNPGGEVRVTLTCQGFAVEDTGHGMTEEVLGRLFTAFFTTKAGGTGLGLCNAKKIVEAHGGTIAASSSPAGSRFVVDFSGANNGQG